MSYQSTINGDGNQVMIRGQFWIPAINWKPGVRCVIPNYLCFLFKLYIGKLYTMFI